jgi:hypothetical protein
VRYLPPRAEVTDYRDDEADVDVAACKDCEGIDA